MMQQIAPCHGPAPRANGTFHDALSRARAEYLEMPGLRLTERQAARLWSCDVALSTAVLSALVQEHFLFRLRDATYVRS